MSLTPNFLIKDSRSTKDLSTTHSIRICFFSWENIKKLLKSLIVLFKNSTLFKICSVVFSNTSLVNNPMVLYTCKELTPAEKTFKGCRHWCTIMSKISPIWACLALANKISSFSKLFWTSFWTRCSRVSLSCSSSWVVLLISCDSAFVR